MKNPLVFWLAIIALCLAVWDLASNRAQAGGIDETLTPETPGGAKVEHAEESTDPELVPEGKHIVVLDILCRRDAVKPTLEGSI